MLTEPKLHIITGPMFSGKTSALLNQYRRYLLAGMRVRIYKPKLDHRYSKKEIVTHDGLPGVEAILVPGEGITRLVSDVNHENLDAIFIDECQFFSSGVVGDIKYIVGTLKKQVFVSCLDMDWRKDPFSFGSGTSHVGSLLAVAQVIEKRTAICRHMSSKGLCGREAAYTRKTVDNEKIVEVGGADLYQPVCWEHWSLPDGC